MTNDLETMIRSTLRDRADDVEPTPELWDTVQRRIRRRPVVPILAWAAGVAALALVVATVVPTALERDGITIEPLGEDAAQLPAGPLTGIVPLSYVAAEDDRMVLRTVDGSLGPSLITDGREGLAAVAVRPGSDRDELAMTFSIDTGDEVELWVGAPTPGPHLGPPPGGFEATRLGVVDDLPGTTPQAIWSPDGDRLAWIERDGSGSRRLVIADAGERPGAAQVERVSETLLPAAVATPSAVATDWEDEGIVVLSSGDAFLASPDGDEVWWLPLDLSGALLAGRPEAGSGVGPRRTIVDVELADGRLHVAAIRGSELELSSEGGGSSEPVADVADLVVAMSNVGDTVLVTGNGRIRIQTGSVEVSPGFLWNPERTVSYGWSLPGSATAASFVPTRTGAISYDEEERLTQLMETPVPFEDPAPSLPSPEPAEQLPRARTATESGP